MLRSSERRDVRVGCSADALAVIRTAGRTGSRRPSPVDRLNLNLLGFSFGPPSERDSRIATDATRPTISREPG
jgi:hypothetical protein